MGAFMFARTMTIALALLIAIVSSIGSVTASASFQEAGEVQTEDVESTLVAELTAKLRPGAQSERIKLFESELRSMYASLPKSAHGGLEHSVVRYALHRLLVERHGWFIKGLEPESDAKSINSAARLKEWVPSYLQNVLEKRTAGRGFDLSELAAFAATLEDLVHDEAIKRLKYIYETMGLETKEPVKGDQAQDLIDMFLMAYLQGGNFSAKTKKEASLRLGMFRKRYPGWAEAKEWLLELEQNVTRRSSSDDNNFELDFAAASQIAEALGAQYHTFNDRECRDLKTTLLDIEDKKHGRVPLGSFYKMGLHTHWQFTEKIDYLRTLGALDESDPNNMAVIVPNYLGSRPQCLEASSFYAVCCRNECEDLMSSIESEIAEPTATAERIIELVSKLTSDTITSPRTLSETLVSRLQQVASVNGGRIPLHGRLFAQWMHHAFPRECPYPHAGGVNPETPDEWMRRTGHESTAASEEERMSHATTSYNASKIASEELPWTDDEQLLIESPALGSQQASAATTKNGIASASSLQQEHPANRHLPAEIDTGLYDRSRSAKDVASGIFDQKKSEKQVASAADVVHQINQAVRTLIFAAIAIGLALVSRLAFPSRASGPKKVNEQIMRGWWATLVLFLFPLLVVCFDSVLGFSSSKEILFCVVSWGLAALIMYQLRDELSGFASKKDDDKQHIGFDTSRAMSARWSGSDMNEQRAAFSISKAQLGNLKHRHAGKDFDV